ncbi:MAG TPA: cupin domain-containing protein [Sphingomicrobium sp.]|nr:cupin domain-containing protein [Sphingomicrobium sp.]
MSAPSPAQDYGADRELICIDFKSELERLVSEGARLDLIYPADDPHTAVLARDGETIRLTSRPDASRPAAGLPPFERSFVLSRAGSDRGEGRAGMLYRDLIPDRLGGRYIASHITIASGGPVEDWVHFHRIALQLIYVRAGWVRVVYEGQGPAFVMKPGDLVLQPPGIRHRVLESSPGLEVVEISAPALHATFADHELSLPTVELQNGRLFDGQMFLRHVAADTPWTEWRGVEAQETGLREASAGLVSARTIRAGGARSLSFPPNEGELVFGFVLDGRAQLGVAAVAEADAFAIPPGDSWTLEGLSHDFRLFHVTTARLDDAATSPL